MKIKNKKIILSLVVLLFYLFAVSKASAADCTNIEIGGTCQVACGTNQDELFPPAITGCNEMKCCVNKTPPAGGEAPTGSSEGWSINSITGYGLPNSSVAGIISGILSWLLLVFGFFGIIGFIISGVIYLMSTGDEDMIERAKAAMTWSIVGVVVGLLGMVIMKAVDAIFRGTPNF